MLKLEDESSVDRSDLSMDIASKLEAFHNGIEGTEPVTRRDTWTRLIESFVLVLKAQEISQRIKFAKLLLSARGKKVDQKTLIFVNKLYTYICCAKDDNLPDFGSAGSMKLGPDDSVQINFKEVMFKYFYIITF